MYMAMVFFSFSSSNLLIGNADFSVIGSLEVK